MEQFKLTCLIVEKQQKWLWIIHTEDWKRAQNKEINFLKYREDTNKNLKGITKKKKVVRCGVIGTRV